MHVYHSLYKRPIYFHCKGAHACREIVASSVLHRSVKFLSTGRFHGGQPANRAKCAQNRRCRLSVDSASAIAAESWIKLFHFAARI